MGQPRAREMIVIEPRAATVLYNFLRTMAAPRTFLLPANVCPIVPLVFNKARVAYEFVDITETDLCLDLGAAHTKVQAAPERYGGILYVRTYGFQRKVTDEFRAVQALAPHVNIVDDRCLCAPELAGEVDATASLTLYSTGYGKYVDVGGGGYGWLADQAGYGRHQTPHEPAALERVTAEYKAAVKEQRAVRDADGDWLDTGEVKQTWPAYWARIQEQQAVVAAHKRRINRLYAEGLPAQIQLAPDFQQWRFNIRVPAKERLLEKIFAAGLFASSHYAALIGVFGPGTGTRARALFADVVNLFNDLYIREPQAEQVLEIVQAHLQEHSIQQAESAA
jgi:hypothetical protein